MTIDCSMKQIRRRLAGEFVRRFRNESPFDRLTRSNSLQHNTHTRFQTHNTGADQNAMDENLHCTLHVVLFLYRGVQKSRVRETSYDGVLHYERYGHGEIRSIDRSRT